MLNGQTAKAMDDVNGAIRLAPSNPDLYKLRADILSSSGNFQGAVADYNRAIGLAPYASVIYNNRAVALANINRSKEAVEDLNSAMELSTTRPNSAASPVFQGSQW
jgi:Flp pilus assembly protein TadD